MEPATRNQTWFEGRIATLKAKNTALEAEKKELAASLGQSYTLHPTPYTLHPKPYTLHPTPYTLHPTPHTPHPTPYTLHPKPSFPLKPDPTSVSCVPPAPNPLLL